MANFCNFVDRVHKAEWKRVKVARLLGDQYWRYNGAIPLSACVPRFSFTYKVLSCLAKCPITKDVICWHDLKNSSDLSDWTDYMTKNKRKDKKKLWIRPENKKHYIDKIMHQLTMPNICAHWTLRSLNLHPLRRLQSTHYSLLNMCIQLWALLLLLMMTRVNGYDNTN